MTLDKLTIVLHCFFIAEECWTFFSCVVLYRREFTFTSAWGLFITLFGVEGRFFVYLCNVIHIWFLLLLLFYFIINVYAFMFVIYVSFTTIGIILWISVWSLDYVLVLFVHALIKKECKSENASACLQPDPSQLDGFLLSWRSLASRHTSPGNPV